MGIWIELGVFVLALAFGLWQIHDVKKAQKKTAQLRAQARASGARVDGVTPPRGTAGPETVQTDPVRKAAHPAGKQGD